MTSKISDYILLTITITSLTSPRGCPDFSLHHPKRFTITMFHYTPSPTSHAHLPLLSDLLQHVSTNLPDLSPPILAVPHLLLQPHVDSPSLAKLCLQLPVLRLHRHKLRLQLPHPRLHRLKLRLHPVRHLCRLSRLISACFTSVILFPPRL
jgi:hypothetical protein